MVEKIGSEAFRISLSGTDWTLSYQKHSEFPAVSPADVSARGYSFVSASVPGTVEEALMGAGELSDLSIGTNVEEAWTLEYGDWWFSKDFELSPEDLLEVNSLIFHGIDTIAEIFLNGALIGHAQNMFIEHEFRVSEYLRVGSNSLAVHIRSPLRWAESKEYASEYYQVEGSLESLWIRKPAHMYGWDIAPRVVSAGLNRGVELVARPRQRIADWWIETESIDSKSNFATLRLHYRLSEAPRERSFEIQGCLAADADATISFSQTPVFSAGSIPITVKGAKLWNPRGLGDPSLYFATLELKIDGVVVDKHEAKVGIRTLELNYQQGSDTASRFEFIVNGSPIHVMGTNWIQLDYLHSRDSERLAPALRLLTESGVNMVRCWGGNLYEDSAFFEWCDEHGILVWQDFALACARYPQNEEFYKTLEVEAESVIKKYRNHPSLSIWCGSNENDDSYLGFGLNPDLDHITRNLLPKLVHIHDPKLPYISGSPTYSGEMFSSGEISPPEQHLWGPRAYFKAPFYAENEAQFVSEIGFHGMPSLATLRAFLSDVAERPDFENPEWKSHETHHRRTLPKREYGRNRLMIDQAQLMFGNMDGLLAKLIPASQITQAEAKKFFIETSRLNGRISKSPGDLRRPARTGVIWWNLLDCWPQTSDAVVDYYFRKKLAYFYVQLSQQPLCIMVSEAQGWEHRVFAVNDSNWHGAVDFKIFKLGIADPVLCDRFELRSDERILPIGTLPLANSSEDVYFIEWSADQVRGHNHYVAVAPPWDLEHYLNFVYGRLLDIGLVPEAKDLW